MQPSACFGHIIENGKLMFCIVFIDIEAFFINAFNVILYSGTCTKNFKKLSNNSSNLTEKSDEFHYNKIYLKLFNAIMHISYN